MINKNLEKAIHAYKSNLVNISGATDIAGLPYREFLDILDKRSVPLNLDTIPLEYGVSSIKKSLKKK